MPSARWNLAVMVPAVLLLSFLSILFGVKLLQDMIYWNREKSSRIILEKQVSSPQEHMGRGDGARLFRDMWDEA